MRATQYAAVLPVSAAIALTIFILGVATAHADDLESLAESMFDHFDADGDGAATAVEIEAAREAAQKRRSERIADLVDLHAEDLSSPDPIDVLLGTDR